MTNTEAEMRKLPTQVQACIGLLIGAGYDQAADELRLGWFGPQKEPTHD